MNPAFVAESVAVGEKPVTVLEVHVTLTVIVVDPVIDGVQLSIATAGFGIPAMPAPPHPAMADTLNDNKIASALFACLISFDPPEKKEPRAVRYTRRRDKTLIFIFRVVDFLVS